jgi:hypothetical protein
VEHTDAINAAEGGLDYYPSQQPGINATLERLVLDAQMALQGMQPIAARNISNLEREWLMAVDEVKRAMATYTETFSAVIVPTATRASVAKEAESKIPLDVLDLYDPQAATASSSGAPATLTTPIKAPSPNAADLSSPAQAAAAEAAAELAAAEAGESATTETTAGASSAANTSRPAAAVISASSAPSTAPHALAAEFESLLRELRTASTTRTLRVSRREDVRGQLSTFAQKLMPLGDSDVTGLSIAHLQHQDADPLSVLRAELTKSHAQIAAIEAQLAACLDARDAHIEAERIPEAEERTRAAIDHYRLLLQLVLARQSLAREAAADVSEFEAKTAELRQRIDRVVGAREEQIGRVEHASTDGEAVHAVLSDTMAEDETARQRHALQVAQLRQAAEANRSQQQRLWAEILNTLKALQPLVEQGDDINAQWRKAVEEEDMRRQDAAHKMRTCEGHEAQLHTVATTSRAASDALSHAVTFMEDSHRAIERRDHPGRRMRAEVDEYIRFYDVFCRYLAFTQECIVRKEIGLANARRMQRSVQFQADQAGQTFDTNLPLYREQSAQLAAQIASLEGDIAAFQQQTDADTLWWSQDVEPRLLASDVAFEPPSLRANELRRDMLKVQVDAVDALTQNEQRRLDEEKRTVRSIRTLCAAARQGTIAQQQGGNGSPAAEGSVSRQIAAGGATGVSPTPEKLPMLAASPVPLAAE